MKIYVDKIPLNALDCLFSATPALSNGVLCNCQIKYRHFDSVDGMSYSFTPGRFTCSLCAAEKCPYLEEIKDGKNI